MSYTRLAVCPLALRFSLPSALFESIDASHRPTKIFFGGGTIEHERKNMAQQILQTAATQTSATKHAHQHGAGCGHLQVKHDGHVNYLHDGHLCHQENGTATEHSIAVSRENPDKCTPGHKCGGHEAAHIHGPRAATSWSPTATIRTIWLAGIFITRTVTIATTTAR